MLSEKNNIQINKQKVIDALTKAQSIDDGEFILATKMPGAESIDLYEKASLNFTITVIQSLITSVFGIPRDQTELETIVKEITDALYEGIASFKKGGDQ